MNALRSLLRLALFLGALAPTSAMANEHVLKVTIASHHGHSDHDRRDDHRDHDRDDRRDDHRIYDHSRDDYRSWNHFDEHDRFQRVSRYGGRYERRFVPVWVAARQVEEWVPRTCSTRGYSPWGHVECTGGYRAWRTVPGYWQDDEQWVYVTARGYVEYRPYDRRFGI